MFFQFSCSDGFKVIFKENVAFKKPTNQSSTGGSGKWKSAYAVNGNYSFRNYLIEQFLCSHTNKDLNAWWEVDLEESIPTSEIRILGRIEEFAFRALNNYIVNIRNEKTEDWEMCYNRTETVLKYDFMIFQCQRLNLRPYRFVRVQFYNKAEYLTLCSVDVIVERNQVDFPSKQLKTNSIFGCFVEMCQSSNQWRNNGFCETIELHEGNCHFIKNSKQNVAFIDRTST